MDAERYSQTLAKLRTLIAINKAQVTANPWPTIKSLQRELVRAHKCIEQISYGVSTDMVFDAAKAMSIEPINFQGEWLVQKRAVKKAIREYKNRDCGPMAESD